MPMDLPVEQLPKEWQVEVRRLQIKVQSLELQLGLQLLKKYGRQSEKLSDAQLQLLDQEPSVSEAEVERRPLNDKASNHSPTDAYIL